MRTTTDIKADLAALEAEVPEPVMPPPGTPDRRPLYRAACEEASRQRCTPERIARRKALTRELMAAERAAKAKAAAARRKSDPVEQRRQYIFRRLRSLGFRRESGESRGSAYYTRGIVTVRVSDHEVPLTDARADAIWNGGFSWAGSGLSFVVDRSTTRMDAARWLVQVRRHARRELTEHAGHIARHSPTE